MNTLYASNIVHGATLTLLSRRTLALTRTKQVSYFDSNCQLDLPDVTETVAYTILTNDDFEPLAWGESGPRSQTIYVHRASQDDVVADIADFAPNQTGVTRLSGKRFSWSVDSAGMEATLLFDDGTTGKYRKLRSADEIGSDILFEVDGSAGHFADAGASVFLDPELALEFLPSTVAGRYYQFGWGDELFPDPRLDGFTLQFNEGGVGEQGSDFVDSEGKVVAGGSPMRWSIEARDLVVRRTYDANSFAFNCEYGTPDCVLFDHRRMIPLGRLSIEGGTRMYVLEERRFPADVDPANTPVINSIRYYETLVPASSAARPASPTAEGPTWRDSEPGALR